MKAKKIKAFVCEQCGELHEDYDSAISCCSAPEEVDAFQCGECDSIYETREEAKECCR